MSEPRGKLTREEFEDFLVTHFARICVEPPYNVLRCYCGDVNCHGWRIVAVNEKLLMPPRRLELDPVC